MLEKKIAALRAAIPDIAIRTTLICGFPGETPEQHEELMEFINKTEFDRLGAFTYSPEENTPAAIFDNQVEESVKEDWQADGFFLSFLSAEILLMAQLRIIFYIHAYLCSE